jgi:hypothetical protein
VDAGRARGQQRVALRGRVGDAEVGDGSRVVGTQAELALERGRDGGSAQ